MRIILSGLRVRYIFVIIFLTIISCKTSESPGKDGKIFKDKDSTSEVALWPEGTEGINPNIAEKTKPHGKRFYNIHNPNLKIYKPEFPNGVGIVLCPGGGYSYVAAGIEGEPTAEILNKSGTTVFVLKYRLPNTPGVNFKHPVPLSDALRAVQFVRYHAASFNIDPNKIGIMGFSAGGHLASMAGTLFMKYNFGSDEISIVPSRPDFMCLVYPVISTEKSLMSTSINSLVDSISDNGVPVGLSSELNVTDETPPTFLVHAKDDQAVNYQNSVVMYEALRKHEIPSELRLYQEGGHGFGIGRQGTDSENWLTDFVAWLSKMKYI